MCGPADFQALGTSLLRLAALAVASGGLLATPALYRVLEDLLRWEKVQVECDGSGGPSPSKNMHTI